MAKLTGLPGSGKRPAFGRNIIYQVARGQLNVQSWPKPRGKPKNPITREQNEWFRQASQLAKYAPSDDSWMSIELAKGGPWYPRDLLMSAMAGRLFEVLIIDGVEFRSVAVRDDVSSDLDFLAGSVVGTIIVRGPDTWQGLVPAPTGNVLTTRGAGALPNWQSPIAGTSRYAVSTPPSKVISTSPFAFKGTPIAVSQPVTIQEIGCQLLPVGSHTYRGALYQIDGAAKITAILGETAEVTGLTNVLQVLSAGLPAPVALTPGNFYVFGWGRIDGGDAFVFPNTGGTSGAFIVGLPQEWFVFQDELSIGYRLAKEDPAVNDTFDIFPSAAFTASLTISL